jgi:hypothetical protein
MLRCVNDGVTTIKPGHQATGKAHVISSDESSFTLFPTSGRVYVWRTPKEAYNPECRAPTVKHWGGSVMVWTAISWYSIVLVPLLPFMAELLQEYVDRLGNQVHPMIQNFRTTMHFPKTTMSTLTQLELFNHGLKSMKVNFSIFHRQ